MEEELEAVKTYCELEKMRVDFDYEFNVDSSIKTNEIEISGMLIQPLIENAIVHGLAPKPDNRKLKLSIKQSKNYLSIVVADNGVGIQPEHTDRLKEKGFGLKLIEERIHLLEQEKKKAHIEVIFVTAFGHYAIKAIRFCALDYILKPINIPDLIKAVNRCQQNIAEKNENRRLKQLVQNLSDQNENKQLVLPIANKLEFVHLNEILYLKSDNNYTTFFLENSKEILVSKPIKEFESILSDQFMRTHQSYLVNKAKIKSLVKSDGGFLLMIDGSNIPISRNRKEEVIQKLRK